MHVLRVLFVVDVFTVVLVEKISSVTKDMTLYAMCLLGHLFA